MILVQYHVLNSPNYIISQIFTLTSICGCPNGCPPQKTTTGPRTPTPTTIGPLPTKASATPSSGHEGKGNFIGQKNGSLPLIKVSVPTISIEMRKARKTI